MGAAASRRHHTGLPRAYDAVVNDTPTQSSARSDEAATSYGATQLRALLLVAVLAFLMLGALQSLYGPSFAALQARYGVSVAQVGGGVSAHFAGGFLGVLAAGLVLARLGYRRSLMSAAALIALGAAVVGLAATWPLALGAAFLAGLGFGQAVVALNLVVARVYGARAGGPLNALNGLYGLGAVVGPAAVALATSRLGPTPLAGTLVFGGVALAALSLALASTSLGWLPEPRRPRSGAAAAFPFGVLLFMLLFFLYVATEIGTPAWIPTHLAPRLGEANAALVASGFWAALTLGRFLVVPIAGRTRPRDLVLGGCLLALLGLSLAQLPALALVGYVIAGLGLAPVYPTTIAWLQWRFGDRGEQVTPLVIASGNLGPVFGAPAVGMVVAASSPEAVPSVLSALAALLLLSVAVTWWTSRQAERRAARC